MHISKYSRLFYEFYNHSIIGLMEAKATAYIQDDFYNYTYRVTELSINSQGIMNGGIHGLMLETMASYTSIFYLQSKNTSYLKALGRSSHYNIRSKARKGDKLTLTIKPVDLRDRSHLWMMRTVNDEKELISCGSFETSIKK